MQQCQKCGYELTLREIQERAECPKCKDFDASRIKSGSSGNGKRKPLFAVISVALLLLGGFFGVRFYLEFSARQELIAKIDQRVREFNGLSMELLDQSAGMTKGGFLEKSSRRIAEIDSVVAASMAVDDSALPGAAKSLADYGKAQRGLIAAVEAYTRADIAQSLAKSELDSATEKYGSPAFQDFIKKSDAEVEEFSKLSLDELARARSGEPGDFIARYKESAVLAELMAGRNAYLKAKEEYDVSAANAEAARLILEMATKKVRIEGLRLNNACGHEFSILNWQPI